ncbi:WecB/TagA/CpsF family glycosyltransferase [Rhodococcus sp. BP-252]|uniref:WecB/TagA/CpsF family glycosyltransferase n=1 Tax=unclassified Rhodococcus (in: high G+C Gram-positive bacteria) TaxID=192944 RepID=UPI001C9B6602|nr:MULTISPECIES: WecB/TagA/CpsF family glycosyltransferase [unclassified Rhodococcus (in: high G+C Gram-positive bacteria)]MBY6414876.1 WecB/TagA/CpsF family glycosyltransferase [Rhodococcus sp. BP-320]MBY6419840.1 WecB/TagA/CpsF family glycosyltransferase [Rhodococcus sp. BP-321]MBY6424173.1 WecB/TagA/CpsF family glycosyltransferase [Rhodococcus sp. BP-324]MBY6429773.1 WecB/TagA/CpsF family glycosyltransferase [Rhodococcus sp. BP-323]MBY6434733.1 WecB/TagA/CpsF family glycosyltransferase [Rho
MVGGIGVLDARADSVVRKIACSSTQQRMVVAYALHIGGLNVRKNSDYSAAMRNGDIVYADGKSVEWLAKIGGARRIERAATTDIGIPVLNEIAHRIGRRVRVALIGGPAGLAEAAGAALEETGAVQAVYACHGYELVDAIVCDDLRAAGPDVVLVGLGMPYEAIWVDRNRGELPECLILTVGGWFGFLTGRESRAPRALQVLGLEWMHRMILSRGRLTNRYLTGVGTFASVALAQLRKDSPQ